MEYQKEFEKETGYEKKGARYSFKIPNGKINISPREYWKEFSKWLESKLTEQREKMLQDIEDWINTNAPRPMNINQVTMRMDRTDHEVAQCGLETVANLLTSLKETK